MVRKTRYMTYMNKYMYIVMFSYENMMSAHVPIFSAVFLLDQNIVVDTCNC